MSAAVNRQWPASLADCTGLRALQLSGTSTAPIPIGKYLERLRTLHWQCSGVAKLLNVLRAATAVETLHLAVAPELVAGCTVINSLPSLRCLHFKCLDSKLEIEHADALLKLRRRLRADVLLTLTA